MTAPPAIPVRPAVGQVPLPGLSSLCRANWPRLRHSLAVWAFFSCTTAHAGGLDEPHVNVDPCPPGLVLGSTVTDEMLAGFRAIRAMSCGHEPRAFFDRASGLPLTDDEITRRIFNGSGVEVIPLPGSLWAMLAGITALAAIRRKA